MPFLPTLENTVNFIHSGDGAPVILIHGVAASLFDWKDIVPELVRAGYAVYALDLLGHGKSYKPVALEDYCIEKVFDHFDGWVTSLDLKQPPVLIGHSLGGYLAIEYTLRYPGRVCALVLADTFYTLRQLPFLLRLYYRRPPINSTLIERIPEWLIRLAIDLTSLSIRNGYILPEAVRVQTAADYKRASPGIFNILQTTIDLTPRLSSVSQPALVLWGARDQTLAPASFSKMLTVMPNSRGSSISGAGHVPHQSHSAEFNRLVIEFLRTVDGCPAPAKE